MLDVVFDVVKQPVHIVQVFSDVIFVVCPAVGIVMRKIVNVDAVFEDGVHLAVGLVITWLVLIVVVHFPADRICFSPQPIGQRIYMTPLTERRQSSFMSMIGLSENSTSGLKTKDGDNGN
jgi:hypothetical protein